MAGSELEGVDGARAERAQGRPYGAGAGADVGVEALARWHHPTLGLLLPASTLDLGISPTIHDALVEVLGSGRRARDEAGPDSDVDIVVEVMGGIEPARTLILAAMAAGSAVVTANKALLSAHGPELFAAAAEDFFKSPRHRIQSALLAPLVLWVLSTLSPRADSARW